MRSSSSARFIATAVAAGVSLALVSAAPALALGDPEHPAPFAIAPDPQAPTLVLKPDAHAVELSSKPSASKTIWLVFGGGELTGTQWNAGRHLQDQAKTPVPYEAPIDFDGAGNDSVALRTEVFHRVAEYFSPFDVNVTTVRPPAEALSKDSLDDQQYGGVVLYTHEMFSSGLQFDDADDADGIAHSGTFGDPTDYYAWVSTADMAGNPKFFADVTAHEVGHTLGLDHQGYGDQDYYYPNGLWAPIMGKGRFSGTARWSDAQYPNAKGGQDDLTVMTDQAASSEHTRYFLRSDGTRLADGVEFCSDGSGENWLQVDGECDIAADQRAYIDSHPYSSGRLNFAADDHGDSAQTASLLAPTGSATGVIGRNGDPDVFSVTLPKAGRLALDAVAAPYGPMLDIVMTVRNGAGDVVGTFNPDLGLVDSDDRYGYAMYRSLTGTGASAALQLPAGAYTVTIEGTGFGDLSQVTLDDSSMAAASYGSLGQYTLTSAFTPDAVTPPTDGGPKPGGDPKTPPTKPGSGAPLPTELARTGSQAQGTLIAAGLLLAGLGAAAVAGSVARRRG